MKTTKNNITDWLEANPNLGIEALLNEQVKKMEYWQKLSDKYIEDTANKTDEEIIEWYKQHTKLQNHLSKRYGESSWRIHEFFELCRAEEISESKFRELVRFEMEESFQKRKTDLKNKYKSQLSELKNREIGKVIDEDKIKEMEIKLKTLEEL